MSKKGISTIVATVLIVLITVAAVTILWAAMSPLVGDNLAQSTNCLNVQNSVKVDTDRTYTHFNTTNEESVSVRVERGANSGDLVGLVISVESDGSTIGSWTFDSSAKFPSENGALVYLH